MSRADIKKTLERIRCFRWSTDSHCCGNCPKDTPPKPKPPKNDGGDEPDKTPRYYIAPYGRTHIDENDVEGSTNHSQS